MNLIKTITPLMLLALSACSDVDKDADGHDGHHHHDHEVMTTVVLTFTPDEGEALSFTWSEVTGEPVIDDIVLADATEYSLSLEFLNEFEDPIEDITPEIADEDDEHQIFITGSAVDGPATEDNADAVVEHSYADEDVNGLPIGLENDITTLMAGSGDFMVTLRHMPLQNGSSIKTESGAADVASGGFAAIGGDNDVQITFALTVE
jgi:hypothetical protein